MRRQAELIRRWIHFESVPNFRDLGGYRTHQAQRRVAARFRSPALHRMDDSDIARLKQDISARAIIDPRRPKDPEREVHLPGEIGARYYPTPFSTWRFPGPSTRPESFSYVKDEAKADQHGRVKSIPATSWGGITPTAGPLDARGHGNADPSATDQGMRRR